jgi:hypothetical protein
MSLYTVISKDLIGTIVSIEPMWDLVRVCLQVRTIEQFLSCVHTYLLDRHVCFRQSPADHPVSLIVPRIILVNHSYELVVMQSWLNLYVVQQNVPHSKLVLVGEASYRDMVPPPLHLLLDRILAGHIRIDRKWTREQKGRVLYDGMLSALQQGHTVVLFGDVDTLTMRNPLRQLYRSVLDRLQPIPMRVFHVWPYVIPYPARDFRISYTSSPILWSADAIVRYRTQVDDRWCRSPP